VSVHTLACAGCEIAEHLTRKTGAEPFSTHALATFPDLDVGKIRRVQNQYWNAFKHALTRGGMERDDRDLLERFKDEINDHTLFLLAGMITCSRSAHCPSRRKIFQVWYFALYPEKLAPEVNTTRYQQYFPMLPSKSRADQKQALREVISSFRQDAELMADPQTDARPLMLGAIMPCNGAAK
jgi:hypothetical protein